MGLGFTVGFSFWGLGFRAVGVAGTADSAKWPDAAHQAKVVVWEVAVGTATSWFRV